jgi:hypothetical protein
MRWWIYVGGEIKGDTDHRSDKADILIAKPVRIVPDRTTAHINHSNFNLSMGAGRADDIAESIPHTDPTITESPKNWNSVAISQPFPSN